MPFITTHKKKKRNNKKTKQKLTQSILHTKTLSSSKESTPYFFVTEKRVRCSPLHIIAIIFYIFSSKLSHNHFHGYRVLSPPLSTQRNHLSNLLTGNSSFFTLRLGRPYPQHSKLFVLYHSATICLVNIEIVSFYLECSLKFSHQLLQSWNCYLTSRRLLLFKVTFSLCCSTLYFWLYLLLFAFHPISLLLSCNICLIKLNCTFYFVCTVQKILLYINTSPKNSYKNRVIFWFLNSSYSLY